MRYSCKKFVALIITVVLICGMFAVTASALKVPDENRTGSVTMIMNYNGTTVKGGAMSIYYVGQIHEEDGNYNYIKIDEFTAFDGSISDVQDSDLAVRLVDYVEKNHIAPTATVENKDGKVIFDELPLGLYLVVQSEPSYGYQLLNPFLVSVPLWEDGNYNYDVNAYGKFEEATLTTSPSELSTLEVVASSVETDNSSEEKTTSAKSSVPVTGQLNWPIAVFTICGLLMFALGWMLYNRKKDKSEK